MAVTTTKTNKPLNPRGNDQSPKGYNRAALYSGKALDFDGVNDFIKTPNMALQSTNVWTYSTNVKIDTGSILAWYIFDTRASEAAGQGAHFISTGQLQIFQVGDASRKSDFVFERNQWYKIDITSDASNVKLYINGVFSQSFSPFTAVSVSGDLTIGARFTNNYSLAGNMGGFKAFDVALTAAQVSDLYNNPEKIVPTGVSNDALKLWLPMQEGAGTTAINGAPDAIGSEMIINGDFSDGSSNWNPNPRVTISGGKATYDDAGTGNFNQTISGGFDISTDYILTFDISDASTYANLWIGNASGSNSYTNSGSYENYVNGHHAVFLKGSNIGASDVTLGFWISTGGSTFSIDNISLKEVANCGTISGATWTHGIGAPVAQTAVVDWNKWKLEGGSSTNEYLIPQGLTAGRDLLGNLFENVRKQGALNLDGNSWAEVHDNESLDITGHITLEAWAQIKDGLSADGILGRWSSSAGSLLYLNGSTDIRFYIDGLDTRYTSLTNGWHHFVGVYNGSTKKLYLDGVEVSSSSQTTGAATSSAPIEIGRYQQSTGNAFDGPIAQPRIYNRALTAAEVLRNYNSGKSIYTNS